MLLPRKPSVPEIFRFYQVRKAFGLFGMGGIFAELAVGWGKTERGAAVVNFDGDVSLAGEEKKRESPAVKEAKRAEKLGKKQEAAAAAASKAVEDSTDSKDGSTSSLTSSSGDVDQAKQKAAQDAAAAAKSVHEQSVDEEEEEEDNDMIHGAVALKFLMAGGIAGAVSRTATAPFDRLKIYLITTSRSPDVAEAVKGAVAGKNGANQAASQSSRSRPGILREALTNLYRDGGGLKAFWVGNGLNCLKIFPESAIKFLSYETSKRAFAKYVDNVSDSRDISGTSRFLSGGIGGITSQLAILSVETLKTRLMSSQKRQDVASGQRAARQDREGHVGAGGLRTYYRGLNRRSHRRLPLLGHRHVHVRRHQAVLHQVYGQRGTGSAWRCSRSVPSRVLLVRRPSTRSTSSERGCRPRVHSSSSYVRRLLGRRKEDLCAEKDSAGFIGVGADAGESGPRGQHQLRRVRAE